MVDQRHLTDDAAGADAPIGDAALADAELARQHHVHAPRFFAATEQLVAGPQAHDVALAIEETKKIRFGWLVILFPLGKVAASMASARICGNAQNAPFAASPQDGRTHALLPIVDGMALACKR